MDLVYEYSGDDMPIIYQIQVGLHAFFCSACARQMETLEQARTILSEDFFVPSPNLEDSIMSRIAIEEECASALDETEEIFASPAWLSTRNWVIAGLIIMVCLATTFFGLEYQNLANETGKSFLLPIGITIGIVLTTYGALFIGSHLKELSQRFGL